MRELAMRIVRGAGMRRSPGGINGYWLDCTQRDRFWPALAVGEIMSDMRVVEPGSDVYVRNPQIVISDCVSITGLVTSVHGEWATIDGYVAKYGGGNHISASFRLPDLGVRIGTPVSRISVVPGEPGYAEWLRISRSWGYD